MWWKLFILLIMSGLGGCVLAAPQAAYQKSVEGYKACLAANPSAPHQCEGLRLALQADAQRLQIYSDNWYRAFNPGQHYGVTVRSY